ncbi:MAG TPA: FAD-binding oxidoreductase [Bryobacteraceae bacterium]|nr:FAD-binding oxidoreductase [Bryobacteraceae bacterium]
MAIVPGSAEEFANCLAEAGKNNRSITVCGNSTKDRMGGPLTPSDVTLSTQALKQVLQYNPRDLTVSVGSGISYCELSGILAQHRQMIPLDPPFSERATMGGIVAANTSGPRRRLYGSARDMVIGMTFATLEGKLIRTGGMVVKNVAGLDMGKLMIGSFGTLAVITNLNFRVYPMPAAARTFVQDFVQLADAITARDEVLKSQLQPMAIDLLKSEGAYQLVIQAGGSPAVLDRYTRELSRARVVEGPEEEGLWRGIRETTPQFLREHENGGVLRVSCKLSEVGPALQSLPDRALARAGSGVCYGYFEDAAELRFPAVGTSAVEFAPQAYRESGELWPRRVPTESGSDFAMMKKIKEMFDPQGLLNRGRLYGRI